MLMRIFKTLSLLGFIGIFFVLLTQREVIFIPKILPLTKPLKPSLDTSTSEALTLVQQDQKTPQENYSVGSSSTPIPSSPVIIETKKLSEKIAEIPKKNVYIPMQEGRSDTDESYKPNISPCTTTMGYRLGTFDTHFGIKEELFKEELNKAATLWGDQLGKTLFTYSTTGPLTINLIYDERQARTDDINNLALEIQNSKNTASSLKNTYEAEKVIYLGDAEQLTKDNDAFKIRYDAYISKVAMYNSQGGAPEDQYILMTKELATLKEESRLLLLRRDNLTTYMEAINAKVTRYNQLVVYINSLITKSNTLGANKFTEGRFTPNTNTIDIYQYSDIVKLRRVITHEFGHVLGINHTENIYSIMYAVNSATTTELSSEDIQALFDVCPRN